MCLPHLGCSSFAGSVQILELAPEDGEDEGGNVDLDSQRVVCIATARTTPVEPLLSGEECGAEDIDTTNYLPASDWACRSQGICHVL